MQFNQLRYVLEAANKKSFSAAAFPCSSDIQNLSLLQRLENTLYSPPDAFSMIQSS